MEFVSEIQPYCDLYGVHLLIDTACVACTACTACTACIDTVDAVDAEYAYIMSYNTKISRPEAIEIIEKYRPMLEHENIAFKNFINFADKKSALSLLYRLFN